MNEKLTNEEIGLELNLLLARLVSKDILDREDIGDITRGRK